MKSTRPEWYIGIDLGTTNSSLSFIKRGVRSVVPQTLKFDQYDRWREVNYHDLLPSFVFFEHGYDKPIFGRYSKYEGIRQAPHRVARSFKLKMDDPTWRFKIEEDNKEYTAAELSYYVLKTLMGEFRRLKREKGVRHAVVTVPASFPSIARDATKEASEKAGIELVDLLDEPKAALFSYLNLLQQEGTFEESDLFSNKTLLVYDLGGGTLDISIHHVKLNPDSPFGVEIEDIVISRFTELGGDDFDNLIAEELLNRYQDDSPELSKLYEEDEDVHQNFSVILMQQAEQLKRKLSDIITSSSNRQEEEVDGKVEPGSPGILRNKGYQRALDRLSISKTEYEEIIKPFLGEEFSLNDLNKIHSFDTNEQKNLIVPLLDVLKKFRTKVNDQSVLPDSILFHGGMSRAWFVEERLKKFFSPHDISFSFLNDPDRACSHGASLYHYYLSEHGQDRFVSQIAQNIISDTYQLQLEGRRLYPLITAGELLPKEKTTIQGEFTLKANYPGVSFPILIGDETSIIKSKVINKQYFELEQPIDTDVPVDIEYSMDENKILSFTAIFPKNSEIDPISIKVDDRTSEQLQKTNEGIKKQQLGEPETLDFVDQIVGLALWSKDWSQDEKECARIDKIICRAVNRDEFFEHTTKKIKEHTPQISKIGYREIHVIKRLSILLGKIADDIDDELLEPALFVLHDLCSQIKNIISFGFLRSSILRLFQNEVLQNVVTTLGKLGDQSSESYLRELIEIKDITYGFRLACVKPLGKVGHSESLFDFLSDNLRFPKVLKKLHQKKEYRKEWRSNIYWSIGKAASQKAASPSISASKFNKVKKALQKQLNIEEIDHRETLRNLFFAIGEVFEHSDEKTKDYAPSLDEQEKYLMALANCYGECSSADQQHLNKIYGIATAQINGVSLSKEQLEFRGYLLSLADTD